MDVENVDQPSYELLDVIRLLSLEMTTFLRACARYVCSSETHASSFARTRGQIPDEYLRMG